MAKENETEVIEEIKDTKPPVEVVDKESFKDKILKHKNKILTVGGVGLGAFILGKLLNHGGRISRLEDYCLSDFEDNDTDGDVDDDDEDTDDDI